MDFISICLLAIALAADCFSVAMAKGLAFGTLVPRNQGGKINWGPLWMSLLFAIFQGGMPLITFGAGSLFADEIAKVDHWIALILLSFIGGKMIWDSCHKTPNNSLEDKHFRFRTIILLAIATSIDALATGILFVPFPQIILKAVCVIASVSFFASILGYSLGVLIGKKLNINIELAGGVLLILIGLKIFLEHTLA